jgi:tRNA nucleotidyltransferase (CCA-adding enzyme)
MKTLDKVKEIALAIRTAGGRAMMVGGCVRDKLLNIQAKDYDLEIYDLSAAQLLAAITPVCEVDAVGMSFGVLKVKHFDIDLALPRKENKTGRGHRGFIMELTPELDFATAASRRDFTINAIMMDAVTEEIIDPWNGRADLEKKILRHVSAAFTEDPLRVLRGMQFIARFDLTPEAETVKLCSTISQSELPPERLASEWEKLLLKGTHITKALNFLKDTGWVHFYPELAALINCPQNPQWHPEGDVWNHTLAVTEAAAKMRKGSNEDDDLVLMLAALCHDFGKPCCTVTDPSGKITSCGHDSLTAPAEKFMKSIWYRKDLPERVIPLVARHMHPWQLAESNSSNKAFRKLALYAKRLDLLADLAEADVRGIMMSKEDLQKRLNTIDTFRHRCKELAIADSVPRPLILGRHLIEKGLKPGAGFKKILDQCFDAQLSGEFSALPDAKLYLDKLLCGK